MTFHVVAVGAMTAKKCTKKCAKLLLFLLNMLLLTVPVAVVVALTESSAKNLPSVAVNSEKQSVQINCVICFPLKIRVCIFNLFPLN